MTPENPETKKPVGLFATVADMARKLKVKITGKGDDSLPGDVETGRYIRYALNSKGQLSLGAHFTKGKRRNPHWNKTKLAVNSRAIELAKKSRALLAVIRAAEGKEISAQDEYLIIAKSAQMALEQVAAERHQRKRLKNAMRDASRRINRGTIHGNSQEARVAYSAPV